MRFGNVANYADTRTFGLYHVSPTVAGQSAFAVCLLDEVESDIAPNTQLVVGGEEVASGESAQRIARPVWPWVLIAALVALTLEWIVYSRRVFV